jgi:hypothetical protein
MNYLRDILTLIVYYLIRYPAIGLIKLQNWIAKQYPYNGDRYPFRGWDKVFWLTMKITEPCRKYEHWLNEHNRFIEFRYYH